MSSNVSYDLWSVKEESPEFSTGDVQGISTRKSQPPVSLTLNEDIDILDQSDRIAGLGVEVASTVIGNLIAHPCIVLRRQCQVHVVAAKFHLTPFTLIPVIIRLQKRQALKVLWKGAGSIFILRGFAAAVETVIAEFTPFPREITINSSVKHVLQHIMLKSITFGILTPFYCSSLVETVQSDIASEKPGVFECLKEGLRRLFRWGTPQSTRLLPVWQLIGPTIAYCLLSYMISSISQSIFTWILSIRFQKKCRKLGATRKDPAKSATKYLDEISAVQFGRMASEITLYPAETVLNRLYLQGTRTIIDNLDSGDAVFSITTKYEGAIDCFHTILREEGSLGLYKGFGALIMEYALQGLIMKVTKSTIQKLASLIRDAKYERETNLA